MDSEPLINLNKTSRIDTSQSSNPSRTEPGPLGEANLQLPGPQSAGAANPHPAANQSLSSRIPPPLRAQHQRQSQPSQSPRHRMAATRPQKRAIQRQRAIVQLTRNSRSEVQLHLTNAGYARKKDIGQEVAKKDKEFYATDTDTQESSSQRARTAVRQLKKLRADTIHKISLRRIVVHWRR